MSYGCLFDIQVWGGCHPLHASLQNLYPYVPRHHEILLQLSTDFGILDS
jgi:hypothetical protein